MSKNPIYTISVFEHWLKDEIDPDSYTNMREVAHGQDIKLKVFDFFTEQEKFNFVKDNLVYSIIADKPLPVSTNGMRVGRANIMGKFCYFFDNDGDLSKVMMMI